jgi:hypothetical protein
LGILSPKRAFIERGEVLSTLMGAEVGSENMLVILPTRRDMGLMMYIVSKNQAETWEKSLT